MALSAWQVNILGFKKVWLVLNSKTQVWFFAVLCPLGRFCTVGRIFLCRGGKNSRSFTSDYGEITNEHNRIAVDGARTVCGRVCRFHVQGLIRKEVKFKHYISVGLWFGGFQALMPLLGYFLGTAFEKYIDNFDHWIAFALLVFLGVKMIIESFKKEEEKEDNGFSFKSMLVLAVATSIDALASGIAFGVLEDVNIRLAISFIGAITCLLSMAWLKIGNVFGDKYKSKSELAGGIILVLIGVKILLSHLGVLPF